jgi:hypothetical protein
MHAPSGNMVGQLENLNQLYQTGALTKIRVSMKRLSPSYLMRCDFETMLRQQLVG